MSGRNWPIWNEITACNYEGEGAKNYGSKDTGECTVKIGTSAKNSHVFVRHTTTRRIEGEYTVFRFGWRLGPTKGGKEHKLHLLATRYMLTKTGEMMRAGWKPEQVAA